MRVSDEYKQKIRKLDKQKDSTEACLWWLLDGVYGIVMIFAGLSTEMKYVVILSCTFSSFLVFYYYRYLGVKDRRFTNGVPLYQITKYAPIPKTAYYKVRMGTVIKFYAKILLAAVALKTTIIALNGTPFLAREYVCPIVMTFLYPVGMLYLMCRSALQEAPRAK